MGLQPRFKTNPDQWGTAMPAGRRKPKGELAHGDNHRNGIYTKIINSGYGSLEMTGLREQGGTLTSQMGIHFSV